LDLEIELAPMKASELDEVEAIESESFNTPWTRDCFASVLRESGSLSLVARSNESVAGYVICFWAEDGFVVANLAVAGGFRSRGVGRKLLEAALEAGRESGTRWALLDVRESNQIAIHLYTGMGFRTVGRRPEYYSHPREDSLVMAVRL
jgi:ribosomal-protein-alanine N-acetyltransferase